jgi:hypothetical protein
MCDFGTGDNNKLNWVLEDKQELIDIIETIYRGAKKGRGLVVSPKGMITVSRSPFATGSDICAQITLRGTGIRYRRLVILSGARLDAARLTEARGAGFSEWRWACLGLVSLVSTK